MFYLKESGDFVDFRIQTWYEFALGLPLELTARCSIEGKFMETWQKIGIGIVGPIVLALIGVGIIRGSCVTLVDNYELGYTYDRMNGEIEVLDHTGYVFAWPLIKNVHTIDLRPMQVCITASLDGSTTGSSAVASTQRTLNCKLVSFNSKGLNLFLSFHGRDDYGMRNLPDLLKIYAYEGAGHDYPFLNVLRDMKTEDVVPTTVTPNGAP